MKLSSDFRDMLRALSSERVRYVVVGGFAVIHHTEPRYTKDIDIWIEPTAVNAARVLRALKHFGAPLKGVRAEDFTNPQIVFQLGVEPVRIDLLMAIKGVSFEEAWASRVTAQWGRQRVNVLSAEHLARNKRRVGRPQDLLDVERLKPLLEKPGRGKHKRR